MWERITKGWKPLPNNPRWTISAVNGFGRERFHSRTDSQPNDFTEDSRRNPSPGWTIPQKSVRSCGEIPQSFSGRDAEPCEPLPWNRVYSVVSRPLFSLEGVAFTRSCEPFTVFTVFKEQNPKRISNLKSQIFNSCGSGRQRGATVFPWQSWRSLSFCRNAAWAIFPLWFSRWQARTIWTQSQKCKMN